MSEHDEQKALFQWHELAKLSNPLIGLLYANPLGGLRHPAVAAKMKAEGAKSGIPDITLPVARHGKHGLYIELKTQKGALSKNQQWWIAQLRAQGYQVEVCRGWQAAAEVIEQYLGGEQ